MLDQGTCTCLCDGSGAEAIVYLAVVVLVAAVEARLVRVAQVAPLEVNMHFAQSESKEMIKSADASTGTKCYFTLTNLYRDRIRLASHRCKWRQGRFGSVARTVRKWPRRQRPGSTIRGELDR